MSSYLCQIVFQCKFGFPLIVTSQLAIECTGNFVGLNFQCLFYCEMAISRMVNNFRSYLRLLLFIIASWFDGACFQLHYCISAVFVMVSARDLAQPPSLSYNSSIVCTNLVYLIVFTQSPHVPEAVSVTCASFSSNHSVYRHLQQCGVNRVECYLMWSAVATVILHAHHMYDTGQARVC